MYNQPEVIMEQYDLEVEKISKGRGAYNCETSQGAKLLKEFRGSAERAEFLAAVLDKLNAAGFETERIMRTKEGKALTEEETGERYILKDLISGTECSTRSREEMKAAAALLGKFHRMAAPFAEEAPKFMKAGQDELENMYEKHNRELVKVKNYIRAKKKKNEFEMKFQEQYPHFMENAAAVTGQLQKVQIPQRGFTLCHGDYNQHNAVYTDQGLKIIHFEYLNGNAAVMDLSNFMRKMLEKNNWNVKLGMELIEAYEKERTLTREERIQLFWVLSYPEKFWKIANHYYNSHKAWLSGRNIEKLDKVIGQEKDRIRFLENIYHNI